MKTIIAGSRHITDYSIVVDAVTEAVKEGLVPSLIVSGAAKGIDSLGERWALNNGVKVDPYPADWDNIEIEGAVIRYHANGKPYNVVAGHMRNEKMAANADALIAIPTKSSKGTWDMIKRAKDHNLRIFIFKKFL